MCKCTNSTEVKLEALCIICPEYLHFTITMNRTSNCYKNGVHNPIKRKKEHNTGYECRFTCLVDHQYFSNLITRKFSFDTIVILTTNFKHQSTENKKSYHC